VLDALDKDALDAAATLTSPQPTRTAYELLLSQLCFAGQHNVLLAAEDVMLDANAPLIDFDFDQGLVSQPSGTFSRKESIFVRVRHVPAGAGVTVVLDGKKISTARQPILGRPDLDTPPSLKGSENRPDADSIFDLASKPLVPSGTIVLTMPAPPKGRRYSLQLCTSKTGRDQRSDCTGATLIGSFEIEVDGKFYLGVRSGIGLGWTDVDSATVRRESGSGDTMRWTVGREEVESFTAIPLLLTWYPFGRAPLKTCLSVGVTAGVDIAKPLDRFYAGGLVLDIGGIGIGTSFVLERVDRVRAPSGLQLTSASKPDLAGQFGTDKEVRRGVAFWLTADLDLFRVLFGELFGAQYPVLKREL
jgi:hypothetical protein